MPRIATRPLDARAWRASWDRQQEFHIPERELRFEVMMELLAQSLPSRARVLDLGCGTGSLSERILRRFPRVRVWALDFDPVLLRLGREGLGDAHGRLTWLEADLRRPGWTKVLPRGRVDAAVSTTALHWLTPPQLDRVYRALAGHLRPGAVVLNGDSMPFNDSRARPTIPRIARITRAVRAERRPARKSRTLLRWDDWWSRLQHEPALAEEVAERRRRYPHAHDTVPSASARRQVAGLRAAGFREAAVVWQDMNDRILLAVR